MNLQICPYCGVQVMLLAEPKCPNCQQRIDGNSQADPAALRFAEVELVEETRSRTSAPLSPRLALFSFCAPPLVLAIATFAKPVGAFSPELGVGLTYLRLAILVVGVLLGIFAAVGGFSRRSFATMFCGLAALALNFLILLAAASFYGYSSQFVR